MQQHNPEEMKPQLHDLENPKAWKVYFAYRTES